MSNMFEKKEQAGPEVRIINELPTAEGEEDAKKIKEKYKNLFGENHLGNISEEDKKELKSLEYPKTPEELQLIDFANKKTNELMERAGVKPYDIPEKNIHIIPPELYKNKIDSKDRTDAMTLHPQQLIAFNAEKYRNNDLYFGETIFHEQMHLKSFLAFEIKQEKEKEKKDNEEPKHALARAGVAVESALKTDEHGKVHSHFSGLHEGIVSYPEKEFSEEMLKLPFFKEEKELLESKEAKKIKENIAKEKNKPAKDIIWVGRNGKDWKMCSYPHHQRVISLLTEEIQKEFPDKYKNPDEVFTEFLRSHFTGRLLNISGLVEKTFGPGSFEVLGMMETEKSSAVKMLDYLRRARVRQSKNKKSGT